MNPDQTIGVLEDYDRCLKNLVRALEAKQNRRDVVALMQELANRDIGRILGLDIPPSWQGENREFSRRIRSIFQDIQKHAELAGAFVGREDVPPALDFLVSGIRLNVGGRLQVSSGAISTATAEKTMSPSREWWRLWRCKGK